MSESSPSADGSARAVLVALVLAAPVFAAGCAQAPEPPPPAAEPREPEPELFTDRAAELGVDFSYFNGMSGEHYYVEHMGGAAALFDYDLDGDLDLYLTQGHMLGPGKAIADALFPPPPGPLSGRLYRNELIRRPGAAPGPLAFTDVTAESGLRAATGYGMGAAVGDFGNDGLPDLYLTHWGSPNQLFENRGDGTFREVTEEAGVGERRWSVAALFVDYDRDGRLDLFVANYLSFTLATHKECTNDLGLRDYCGPASYQPVPDVLFRNLGRGEDGRVRFEDVTVSAGLTHGPAAGLGAVSGDFNGDGWPDLYVANDGFPNNLLVNLGAGGRAGFRDDGLLSGAAMNAAGQVEAGMGVDGADFDADGDLDILVVHLDQETDTLYVNDGAGLFRDRTAESGLAGPSLAVTGFGAGFLDYDNDGWLDVLVANGAIKGVKEQVLAGDPFPLRQRNQLFRNLGDGTFEDVSSRAGAAFELSEVSRGAAFGDLDNDGDTDAVVVNNAGPVRLLVNTASVNSAGQDRGWLGLRLVAGEGGPARDVPGARAELHRPGGPPLVRWSGTDGSYGSAHDPRVLFGLGDAGDPAKAGDPARAGDPAKAGDPARIEVLWPDGSTEVFEDVPGGAYTTLRKGEGRPAG